MQKINDLKFAYKLPMAFGLVLMLMLAQGIVSYVGMSSIARETGHLVDGTMQSLATGTGIKMALGQYRDNSYRGLVRASDAVKEQARREAETVNAQIGTLLAEYEALLDVDNEAARKLYEDVLAAWGLARLSYVDVNEMIDLDLPDDALDTFLGETNELHAATIAAIDTLIAHDNAAAEAAEASVRSTHATSNTLVTVMLLAGIALGMLIAWAGAMVLTRRLRRAVEVANSVASGNLDNEITVNSKDEVGELLLAMQRMQHDLRERIEEDRKVALENMRIRTALDASGTSVMIADANRNIIYANEAMESLLQGYLDEIHKDLSHVDPDALVGTNIDGFHADPQRIARLLESLEGTHRGEIRMGDAHFVQNISPVRTADGSLLGYVVEWRDRTPQVRVEDELAQVIRAAVAGDLSQRITLDGKEGFYLLLAEQLNRLLEENASSLEGVLAVLQALAAGDLTVRMDGDYEGVFARMRDDTNRTTEQLTALVASIQQASSAINAASGEIAAGNSDLSTRTEQQAANLEETAASMEELTSTVRQNAEHAHQANHLVINAAEVATRGGDVVGQVVGTMHEIEQASRRIAEILSVIDGIAFQTNILALNAAVEAARAGEQGRGFAVVAAEVRSLAQRSATAAKEIKTLIDDSVAKVASGSTLAEQAGQTMGEMVTSVRRVTDIMAEISAASQEQASGIEQVNQTIAQMDETTQQNAALVEEASAAARSMEQQAGELSGAVSVFRLNGVDETEIVDVLAIPASRTARTGAAAPAARRPAPRRVQTDPALAGEDWQEF
ncbi:methyl-accepting chemotaxis protein [Luteimonas sp. A478]